MNASSSSYSISGNTGKIFSIENGATLILCGASTFPLGFSTVSLQSGSSVNYNGGSQTISPQNYGNLVIGAGSSSRTVTLSNTGTIGISNIFSPSVTNNSYEVSGSTVSFNGASPQDVPSEITTYENLVIDNSASGNAVTLKGPITINNNFTLTNGKVLTTATNILTMGPSANFILNAPVSQDNSFILGLLFM